jgi:hypothetical protein
LLDEYGQDTHAAYEVAVNTDGGRLDGTQCGFIKALAMTFLTAIITSTKSNLTNVRPYPIQEIRG